TVAESVLTAFRHPILTSSQSFSVRLSIGTALGADADSPATLLRNADTALYEAKRLGRGQAQAYTESMHARVARRYNVAEALRAALDRDETTVVIQPVVRLQDGVIVGGEALSRWDSPELGRIGPDEFIVVAEQHGLSATLTARVIAKVVSALSSWPGSLSVSVNVSPGDLADSGIVTALIEGARAVHPHVLGVEVTERLLLSDPAILTVLQVLRKGGLQVYIDDFGTGYSSLAYLKDMPADYLKVPREFVRDIAVGSRTLAVVDAIVAVGRALGLQVVGEGIETETQQRLLGRLGMAYAQGYLFSAPLPLERFRDFVAESLAERAA
ncbi:MAG: putative bifunctional diguanylate cyclase/phosphodiesterase, partial [Dehalococcoidia bacterium]